MRFSDSLRRWSAGLVSTEERRFWVGQLLSGALTVVAIYLAAYVGYARAMQYDHLVDSRDRYHLMLSMSDELEDNLQTLEHTGEQIGKVSVPATLGQLELEQFVWELMRGSDQTARFPRDILTGTRRFYADVAALLHQLATHRARPEFVKTQLEEQTEAFRTDIQPKIDMELKRLADEVAAGGLPLG